jgi:cytochrome b subunit of formate dehydrogenase
MSNRIYIYKRYERFWHWSQAALVIFMLLTGFEIHGVYANFGFQRAVEFHTLSAWALLTLWALANAGRSAWSAGTCSMGTPKPARSC